MEFALPLRLTTYDWIIFLLLVMAVHWFLAIKLTRSQCLKRFNVSSWGPVIFFRTTRFLDFVDWLSRPKSLWRLTITVGIPLVIFGMLLFLGMLVLLDFAMVRAPPEPSVYTSPRNVLLIPGLNQFIPVWYGWLAFLITIIVHEFSHGILCRVEGIRIKSMGVAMLLAPVAAFVEPDEEELFGTEKKPPKASRSARVRILAAGVIANFVVAALAMAIFFGPVIGAIAPTDKVVVGGVDFNSTGSQAGFQERMILLEANGQKVKSLSDLSLLSDESSQFVLLQDDDVVNLTLEGPPTQGIMVTYVFEGSPAADAGMISGPIITEIDGVPITNWDTFKGYMNTTREGQKILIGTNQGQYEVNLASNPDGSGTGFIGVGFSTTSIDAVHLGGVTFLTFPATSFLAQLKEMPHRGFGGIMTLMGLPFTGLSQFTERGFSGFMGPMSNFFEPTGWAKPLGDKVFWIANILLWVGWINLYAGLFNCLPAVPLDGGHIFRDLLHMGFQKVFRSDVRAERMTNALVAIMAWLIFSSLLFMIVGPYLAHGLGG